MGDDDTRQLLIQLLQKTLNQQKESTAATATHHPPEWFGSIRRMGEFITPSAENFFSAKLKTTTPSPPPERPSFEQAVKSLMATKQPRSQRPTVRHRPPDPFVTPGPPPTPTIPYNPKFPSAPVMLPLPRNKTTGEVLRAAPPPPPSAEKDVWDKQFLILKPQELPMSNLAAKRRQRRPAVFEWTSF